MIFKKCFGMSSGEEVASHQRKPEATRTQNRSAALALPGFDPRFADASASVSPTGSGIDSSSSLSLFAPRSMAPASTSLMAPLLPALALALLSASAVFASALAEG